MSGSHHHHHGRPPRDANAEASAVRGRLAWVRSTFSPMMMAATLPSEGGQGGDGSGGRSGSGSSPAAAAVPSGSSRSIASQVVAAYSDILEGEAESSKEKKNASAEIGSSFFRSLNLFFEKPKKTSKTK